MVENSVVKGSPLQIGERTIHPIIQISTLTREGEFHLESILPLAIAVLEPGEKYLISFNKSDSPKMDYPELDQICEELGIKTRLYAETMNSDDFTFNSKKDE